MAASCVRGVKPVGQIFGPMLRYLLPEREKIGGAICLRQPEPSKGLRMAKSFCGRDAAITRR